MLTGNISCVSTWYGNRLAAVNGYGLLPFSVQNLANSKKKAVYIQEREKEQSIGMCHRISQYSNPAFFKLWSADHKWSSGSALVVLLD